MQREKAGPCRANVGGWRTRNRRMRNTNRLLGTCSKGRSLPEHEAGDPTPFVRREAVASLVRVWLLEMPAGCELPPQRT